MYVREKRVDMSSCNPLLKMDLTELSKRLQKWNDRGIT